ncbi:MAG: HDOD domain-containing protein [Desulfonatronovibrionaceae bacterium]
MAMEDIHNVAPGMVLADNIVTPNGRLILPRGVVLKDSHINYLKKWGIARVNVQAETPFKGAQSQLRRMLTEEIESFLIPMYACNDLQNPLVESIYGAALDRLLNRAVKGWKVPKKQVSMPVNDGSLRDQFFVGEFSLEDLISHEVDLASFPDIYFKVYEAINSSRSNADYLARVISNDISLCAKLLRLVNSPFYGLRTRVDSISRAIALVGADELSTLALGISAISAFKDIPPQLIDMKSFWSHSVAVGILCRRMAGLASLPGEKMFVGGLLHDMGRLIIFKKMPAAASEAIIYSQTNLLPLVEAEKDIFRFDHAQAGAALARAWNLPDFLQDQLGRHHDQGRMDSPEAALTHLADFMAAGMLFAEKGSLVLPPLNQSCLESAGLETNMLEQIVSDVENEFNAVVSIFFS